MNVYSHSINTEQQSAEDYKAECEQRVRREDQYGDAHGMTKRVVSCLNHAGGMSDGSEYSKANLRVARKHAERLLAIIVELGG